MSRSYLLNSQLPSVIQKGNDCSSTGNYQKLQCGNKTLTSIWWKQIRFLWSSKGIEQNTNKRNACIAIYSCFHSSIEYFNCSKCQGWQHNKRYMTGCNAFTNQGTIFWVGYQESEEYAWAIVKPREVWLVTTFLAHRNLVTRSFPFPSAAWTDHCGGLCPHRPAHTGFTPTLWDWVYAHKIPSAVFLQCYHKYFNLFKFGQATGNNADPTHRIHVTLLILYWLLKAISHSHFMRSFSSVLEESLYFMEKSSYSTVISLNL